MTDNTLALGISVIAALLVGVIFGHLLFPSVVTKDVIKEVPGPTVTKEVVKEVPAKNTDYRSQAVKTVNDRFGTKDFFLTCVGNNKTYDPEEVSISRLYDDYSYTPIDSVDNKYAVTFKARYSFDTGKSGIDSCRETRTYKVTYENDKHPLIEQL